MRTATFTEVIRKPPATEPRYGASEFPSFSVLCPAIENLADGNGQEARGAVFTRREIVDFILDLTGYTANVPIYRRRILEPSFGQGSFLFPILDRLLTVWRRDGGDIRNAVNDLSDAIRGVEIHRATYEQTFTAVKERLEMEGVAPDAASILVYRWLRQGDFLLEQLDGSFDFVVGNPPYVRQERILAPLLNEYRRRYRTLYDRADLYIPFFERSLSLLAEHGTLGFICADRWMKNRYGGLLRKFISDGFHVRAVVDMADAEAFCSDVSAYPAVVVITRSQQESATRIAHCRMIEGETLSRLSDDLRASLLPAHSSVTEVSVMSSGAAPWLLTTPSRVRLIRRLEEQFPTLEEAGCKIGIGVATGADSVFIGNYAALDVEPDRKLPLVMTNDIKTGSICWQGQGVVNPFEENGSLVSLSDYPRMAAYLCAHKSHLSRRHCARTDTARWYKTIDRISPALTYRPKLLIPDIKGEANAVLDDGRFYPHHNLYYIISDDWDLRALQAVLKSPITLTFIETYSTRMRGGYLRFQAQYLRRLRLPLWRNVPDNLRRDLCQSHRGQDVEDAVCALYQLIRDERDVLFAHNERNS